MDVNEQIVRAWLETQNFLVKSRLRYKVNRGWSDIDLIALRLHDSKRVAVDISAWMTESITFSYVKDPKSDTFYRLFKSSSKDARSAIREEFGVHYDNQYELWLVVSYVSRTQREQVLTECLKYVDRVIEFPEIMKYLVNFINDNPNRTYDSEALQTIRALVLCGVLPSE